jgi:predicted nucleotidyltransferase component of viral defense system
VGATDRYASPAAFRAALEHRLRREAQRSSVTLQRLRKEAAYHRLLYRLQRAAPDSWAIKGGFALILRLGEQARATRDVDANWRATATSLEDALSIVEEMTASDWFTFDIGDARSLQGEGEDGAYRYAVTATRPRDCPRNDQIDSDRMEAVFVEQLAGGCAGPGHGRSRTPRTASYS